MTSPVWWCPECDWDSRTNPDEDEPHYETCKALPPLIDLLAERCRLISAAVHQEGCDCGDCMYAVEQWRARVWLT